ncbi:unnamed protein product [Cunninghamella blakesleeana]
MSELAAKAKSEMTEEELRQLEELNLTQDLYQFYNNQLKIIIKFLLVVVITISFWRV